MTTDTCPWCGATGKWRKDGVGRILEWGCESYSSKSIASQSDRCKLCVLQAEIKRLREFIQNEYDQFNSHHPHAAELRSKYPWLSEAADENKRGQRRVR